MTKKCVLSIGLGLLICSLLYGSDSDTQARNAVGKFKQSEVGRVFLRDHSEKDIEKVVAFLRDPVANFRGVRSVGDVCAYIHAYAQYVSETGDDPAGYLKFLSRHFRVATKDNVPILTYLVLNCRSAFLSEAWVAHYAELFRDYPGLFAEDLSRRKNWKRIVEEVSMDDPQAIEEGLAKLGQSKFERALKSYFLSISKSSGGNGTKAILSIADYPVFLGRAPASGTRSTWEPRIEQ